MKIPAPSTPRDLDRAKVREVTKDFWEKAKTTGISISLFVVQRPLKHFPATLRLSSALLVTISQIGHQTDASIPLVDNFHLTEVTKVVRRQDLQAMVPELPSTWTDRCLLLQVGQRNVAMVFADAVQEEKAYAAISVLRIAAARLAEKKRKTV